jgi:hypothetical protein
MGWQDAVDLAARILLPGQWILLNVLLDALEGNFITDDVSIKIPTVFVLLLALRLIGMGIH